MNYDDFTKELAHYISECEKVIQRFVTTRDSKFLAGIDERAFSQFVSEVIDLLRDELVDQQPASRIAGIYRNGTSGWLHQASYNCVADILGELKALDRRMKRNPHLLKGNQPEKRERAPNDRESGKKEIMSEQPTPPSHDTKVFLSHSSEDSRLVDSFVRRILVSFGLDMNRDIFFTSLEGMGIETGRDWREELHSQLLNSCVFIPFLSEAYRKSEICMNELGAAWILEVPIFPLVVPPQEKGRAGVLIDVSQQKMIHNDGELDSFRDDLAKRLHLDGLKTPIWNQGKNLFLEETRPLSQSLVAAVADTINEKERIQLAFYFGNYSPRTDGIQQEWTFALYVSATQVRGVRIKDFVLNVFTPVAWNAGDRGYQIKKFESTNYHKIELRNEQKTPTGIIQRPIMPGEAVSWAIELPSDFWKHSAHQGEKIRYQLNADDDTMIEGELPVSKIKQDWKLPE